LGAIKQSKTNLKVFLGIYLDVDYQRQKTALKEALQTYGTSNILGITVDNMFNIRATIFNGTNGSAVSNGNSTDIRQMLTSINAILPVGPANGAGSETDRLSASDFVTAFIIPQRLPTIVADLFLFSSTMVKVDPWYNNARIQDATK